jgi:hypothetical protein
VQNRAGKQQQLRRNVSLYKFNRLSLPSRPQMKSCAQRLIDVGAMAKVASVNDGTYRPVQTFPIQAPRFHIEIAHTSIGIHNEYFLHHRRSGSYRPCRRLPWSARLNIEWQGQACRSDCDFRDGYSRTNGFVCQRCTWLRGEDGKRHIFE